MYLWSIGADLPHNLAWSESGWLVHHKGACPARLEPDHLVFPDGHPVIVPGSMGTESWLLKGLGAEESLSSAPHGAGRALSRNAGRAGAPVLPMRVVTRVDLDRVRTDICRELRRSLAEEVPSVYKDIGPVIDTVVGAGIATRVARLAPILMVKG